MHTYLIQSFSSDSNWSQLRCPRAANENRNRLLSMVLFALYSCKKVVLFDRGAPGWIVTWSDRGHIARRQSIGQEVEGKPTEKPPPLWRPSKHYLPLSLVIKFKKKNNNNCLCVEMHHFNWNRFHNWLLIDFKEKSNIFLIYTIRHLRIRI